MKHKIEERLRAKIDGLRSVGLELEYAAVDKDTGKGFDTLPVLELLSSGPGYSAMYDDYYKDQLIGVEDPLGRLITLEFGSSVIEVALPPRESLYQVMEKDGAWLRSLRSLFNAHGATLLGYGGLIADEETRRTKKRRYEVLAEYLGQEVYSIGPTASSQVNIDITSAELVDAINVCNAFSGISIALTANSSIVTGKDRNVLAYREGVWDTFAPERAGVPERKFSDIEDYLNYVWQYPLMIEKVGSEYVIPGMSFSERVKESPELFWDIYPLHEGTVWPNARLRAKASVIEIRPNCQQPHKDFLVIAAFWLGIIEALEHAVALEEFLDWSVWRRFRTECIKHGLNAKVDGIRVDNLARYILEVAEEGLLKRGLGEEVFLYPLRERLDNRRTPAEDARDAYRQNGVKGLIKLAS